MQHLHWQRLKTRKRNEIVRNKGRFVMWNEIEASCGMQVCVWPHGGVWDCPHSNVVLQQRGVIMQTTQDKEPRESMQAMSPSNIYTSPDKLTPLLNFPSLYLFIYPIHKHIASIYVVIDTFMMHFRVSKNVLGHSFARSYSKAMHYVMQKWCTCFNGSVAFWHQQTHTLPSFHQMSSHFMH